MDLLDVFFSKSKSLRQPVEGAHGVISTFVSRWSVRKTLWLSSLKFRLINLHAFLICEFFDLSCQTFSLPVMARVTAGAHDVGYTCPKKL